MGNTPVWLFNPGWQTAVNGLASQDMVRFNALFLARAWFDLVPDQAHKIVTAGWGEENGLDYVAAARTSDGATIIIYLPVAHEITVDLTQVAGNRTQAWWFDPRTGKSRDAGLFPAGATQRFTPPAEGDWVLVLDDDAKHFPAP
jgi:hypothetical protein